MMRHDSGLTALFWHNFGNMGLLLSRGWRSLVLVSFWRTDHWAIHWWARTLLSSHHWSGSLWSQVIKITLVNVGEIDDISLLLGWQMWWRNGSLSTFNSSLRRWHLRWPHLIELWSDILCVSSSHSHSCWAHRISSRGTSCCDW